ncbi:hypothetical protein BD311DRAFT_598576, partial [Dichomitus squalens]
TMQSPTLPWEVIERAIDCCSGDNATLCACALTCSQLHPRSLFVLFANVDIKTHKQLMKFYEAVQAKPHLQPVVQSLSFPWDQFSPFSLLSILPGLRHVTFDSITRMEDTQFSPPTPLCVRQFSRGLRSLTIRRASFPMQTAFLNFLSAY